MVYTLVDRELREAMRTLCRSARLHYCDLLGHPIESIAKVSGMAAKMTPGARPPLNSIVFQADGGDRVRGQVRRRRRQRPRRGGRRARRRLAHVEDAALDLPRLPRPEGGERADREGDQAAAGAVRDRPAQDRRPDDRRRAAGRDPRGACAWHGGQEPPVRGDARDLRRAGGGGGGAPPARLPGDRGDRPLDRGDGAPCRPARRPPPARGAVPPEQPKPPVPKWRWGLWWTILARRGLRLLRAADADLARAARAGVGWRSGGRAAS